MTDEEIVALYFDRSQEAVRETERKYGRYCHTIAYRVLEDHQDSDECVNDTYLRAWRSIPPQRPRALKAFLGRITRNLALDRWDRYGAGKRGGGEAALALDELEECVGEGGDALADRVALAQILDDFLAGLPRKTRLLFVRRYWYLDSIEELAERYHASESAVKAALFRARGRLKGILKREGIYYEE